MLSDVKIRQTYNGATKEYHGHKVFLLSSSEWFFNAIMEHRKDTTDTIECNDDNPAHFETMLKHFYTGNIQLPYTDPLAFNFTKQVTELLGLWNVASKYRCDDLQRQTLRMFGESQSNLHLTPVRPDEQRVIIEAHYTQCNKAKCDMGVAIAHLLLDGQGCSFMTSDMFEPLVTKHPGLARDLVIACRQNIIGSPPRGNLSSQSEASTGGNRFGRTFACNPSPIGQVKPYTGGILNLIQQNQPASGSFTAAAGASTGLSSGQSAAAAGPFRELRTPADFSNSFSTIPANAAGGNISGGGSNAKSGYSTPAIRTYSCWFPTSSSTGGGFGPTTMLGWSRAREPVGTSRATPSQVLPNGLNIDGTHDDGFSAAFPDSDASGPQVNQTLGFQDPLISLEGLSLADYNQGRRFGNSKQS